MINDTIQKIFAATRGGLDIILDYYPQAEECVGKHGAKFKIREEERTPSASIREKDGKWRVTDFGDSGHEMDAIEVCKLEERISYTSEAIALLAQRYHVDTRICAEINKPKISQRDARPDEVDGASDFSTREHFTAEELQLLGPLVEEKHCRDLGWSPVAMLRYVKNRKVTEVCSTDHYPIFARQCTVRRDGRDDYFYKIYQPWYIGKDGDKSRRFSYMPAGKKPQHYVNGLIELKRAWQEWNENERESWESDSENERKPYKDQKLEHAFLCSGERDALCLRSLGYWPLWLNSESDEFMPDDYREVMKMVETLYNIPDLDATGIERGTHVALKYLDVRTIWLPERMRRFSDSRGGGAKDFRDYIGIYKDKGGIKDLMELACPAKFWTARPKKDGGFIYEIDTECLHYFLGLNGFATLKDDTQKEVQYIRREGWRVKKQTPKDVTQFLIDWCRQRALPREIRNLVLNTPKLGSASLERLGEVELDFTSHTATQQFFYFQNSCVEVTSQGLRDHKRKNPMGCCVWEQDMLKHNYRNGEDLLQLHIDTGDDGQPVASVTVKDVEKSPFLCYLVNSSRLFWREELETGVDGLATDEERQAYRRQHRYDIAGPLLSDEQRREQQLCLLNKVFTIGYLLHRYKRRSRPWIAVSMDYKVDEEGRCNGGTGKSFMFKVVSDMMATANFNGKEQKLTEDRHWLSTVKPYTDLLLIDDCDRYLSLRTFYALSTGPMRVNPKNQDPYEIPFESSPKIALSTNYVIPDLDASTLRRLLPVVFSDYYHDSGGLDELARDGRPDVQQYRETRTISDDFDFDGDLLTPGYRESFWEQDLHVLLECVRIYMALVERGMKILPPMKNILERKHIQDMGPRFEEWAVEYFAEDSGRLDCFVVRRLAFEDFKQFAHQQDLTPQRFMQMLNGFVQHCDYLYELNPADIACGQKRIMRRPTVQLAGVTGSVEMLYIRTRKERDRLLQQHSQSELPW